MDRKLKMGYKTKHNKNAGVILRRKMKLLFYFGDKVNKRHLKNIVGYTCSACLLDSPLQHVEQVSFGRQTLFTYLSYFLVCE